MFLIYRNIPHEALWCTFLERAASMQPPWPLTSGGFLKVDLPHALGHRPLHPVLPVIPETKIFKPRRKPAPPIKQVRSIV